MMVVNEGGVFFQYNMMMVVDGYIGIEYLFFVVKIYDDVRQFWSYSDVGIMLILVVVFGGIEGECYWYQYINVWENECLFFFVFCNCIDLCFR